MLLGSAALLVGQEAQPTSQPRATQPGATQPRIGQPAQPGQPGQFGRPGQAGAQAQQLEPSIVSMLIMDNNKEIALSQLGQKTSENDQVKHFCEMIAKDHSEFVRKLQEQSAEGRTQRVGATGSSASGQVTAQPPRPISPTATQSTSESATSETTRTQSTASAQPNRAQPAQASGARTAQTQSRNDRPAGQESRTADHQSTQTEQRITLAKPVVGNQPGSELLQLHHEVAEACLEHARRDAEKMSAAEFDQNFMGSQIVAHKEMLAKLQVFERHVSPQVKELLSDAQETTKKHLEEAMSIHEGLGKQSGRATSESKSESKSGRNESRRDRE
jgi:hypothetical protein